MSSSGDHDQWSVQINPKADRTKTDTQAFGRDFAGCLIWAIGLKDDLGYTHEIHLHRPSFATDNEIRRIREAGFEPI
jgi:hypothetical protein